MEAGFCGRTAGRQIESVKMTGFKKYFAVGEIQQLNFLQHACNKVRFLN
jgi:hypothetical protein